MNVHISYKGDTPNTLEADINKQIEKLGKRLQVFRPDLIHLRVSLDAKPPREGFYVSLDLRLPSGDIAAQETGTTPDGALKKAFDDLVEQLTKHKDQLRAQHKWVRRRSAGRTRPQPQVPFEETIAAVHPEAASNEDVDNWVNVNLYRLVRFVDRELRYREANGQIAPEQVAREEVVNETIARALSDGAEKPDRVTLEPWLFHLSRRAMDDLVRRSDMNESDVPVHSGAGTRNVTGSDEDTLQYHQPDETPLQQDNIVDRGAPTPEEIAASDEVIAMMDLALHGTRAEDREAFLLYVIEGFTIDEIMVISGRRMEDVRKSILNAREHLRRHMPGNDRIKKELLNNTRIA